MTRGGTDEEPIEPAEACFAWPPQAPRPGEGLLGWLLREASDQHVPTIGVILARATPRSDLRAHQRIGCRLDVQALADATMTDKTIISRLMYQEIDDERIGFNGANVPRWHLESRSRRFSPTTLGEGAMLAAWEHKFLPFCPTSWEFLTDRCCEPRCTARQTWHWAVGIDCCPRCGSELSARPRRTVPVAWRERLSIVASLTCGAAPATFGEAIPSGLYDADPGDVLELIHALFPLCGERALTISTSKWWQRRPVRLASTLAAATGLLAEWPCAIIERFASLGGRRAAEVRGAGAVLKGRNIRVGNPAAALLTELANGMRVHGTGRGPGSDKAYSIGTATSLLGSGTAIVAAKRRRGMLRTSPMLRNGEVVLGLDRADIDDVVDKLKHRLSGWKVGDRLGMPRYAVEDLSDRGILSTSSHPYIADRYGSNAFDSREVDEFIRSIEARSTTDAQDEIPLRAMMQSIGGCLKPWASTAAAIAGGIVRVRVEVGHRPLVDRIHVWRTDVGPLLASVFEDHPEEDQSRLIILGDAIEILNLKAKHGRAVSAAMHGREAVPVSEILSPGRAFISPTEITARWGTDGRTAAALIRRILPHTKRDPLGWPREVIETLSWPLDRPDEVSLR